MEASSRVIVSRFTMEAATALITGLVGGIVCYGSMELGIGWGDAGPQPGYFPFYIGLIIIIASAINLVMAFVHRSGYRAEEFLTAEQGMRVVAFCGPMLFFLLAATYVGMYLGMFLYLMGVMVFQGNYRVPKALLIAVITVVINYVLFEVWFQVPLLKGPLEPLLGIH